MGGDRRRQRQQRIRHDPGSGASNIQNSGSNSSFADKKPSEKSNHGSSNKTPSVAYAEPKEYEAVTVMESKLEKEQENSSTKYKKRQVLSNWSRYEEVVVDDDIEEGEDYMLGEDFSKVLQLNEGKSGGYLHLKGEMSWGETDSDLLGSHGLGALKLADLVSAINTIPLHIQLNIPQHKLNKQLVEQFLLDAETNKLNYKPNEEFVSDVDVNEKFLQSLKISESESLDLASDVPDANVSNPVDATMSFASAFQPEEGDVDLEDMIYQSSDSIQESLPLSNKQLRGGKEKSNSPLPEVRSNTLRSEKSPSPMVLNTKESSPGLGTSKLKEKSPSPLVISSNIKEKSPTPTEIQRSIKNNNLATTVVSSAPIEVPPLIKTESTKSLSQDTSKSNSLNTSKQNLDDSGEVKTVEFNIPKLDTSAPRAQRSNRRGNRNKNLQEETGTTTCFAEPSETDGTKDSSFIDLEAPIVKEEKPVLLATESETQNLEDWLDSVLDD